MSNGKNQELCLLFLIPWEPLQRARAAYFEKELARELGPNHALYKVPCTAIALTGASDDVLFRLDTGAFAQIHLTYTQNPPEPAAGFPRSRIYETLADWMIEIMLEEHIEYL